MRRKLLAIWMTVGSIAITWELLLSPVSVIAGVTQTVAYKLSVTIPEHPMIPADSVQEVSINPSDNISLTEAQGSMETIREETYRDQQPVILLTSVVK